MDGPESRPHFESRWGTIRIHDHSDQILKAASARTRSAIEDYAIYAHLPVVRAYQILNQLLDDPMAYKRDAMTVDFWRDIRDGARKVRDAA